MTDGYKINFLGGHEFKEQQRPSDDHGILQTHVSRDTAASVGRPVDLVRQWRDPFYPPAKPRSVPVHGFSTFGAPVVGFDGMGYMVHGRGGGTPCNPYPLKVRQKNFSVNRIVKIEIINMYLHIVCK